MITMFGGISEDSIFMGVFVAKFELFEGFEEFQHFWLGLILLTQIFSGH